MASVQMYMFLEQIGLHEDLINSFLAVVDQAAGMGPGASNEELAPDDLATCLAGIAANVALENGHTKDGGGPADIMVRLANYLHEHPEEDLQLRTSIGGIVPNLD